MSRAADKPVRDPREARAFRFVRCSHADGVAELVYAFDDGPELVERVRFPGTPPLSHDRGPAFDAALRMLHLFTGISYYKAGLPPRIEVETGTGRADGRTAGCAVPARPRGVRLPQWTRSARADRVPAGCGRRKRSHGIAVPARGLLAVDGGFGPGSGAGDGKGFAPRAGADRWRQGFAGGGGSAEVDRRGCYRDVGRGVAVDRVRGRAHGPADAEHRPRIVARVVRLQPDGRVERPYPGHRHQLGDTRVRGDPARLRRHRVRQRTLGLRRDAGIRGAAGQPPVEQGLGVRADVRGVAAFARHRRP